MRRRSAALFVTAGVALFLAWPGLATADRTTCEGIEASLRSAVAGTTWTTEQKEAYVRDGAASCWEEVRAEEALEAEQDDEVRRAQEK